MSTPETALLLKTILDANSSLVLDEVLDNAAGNIAAAVGLDDCGVFLVNEEGNRCTMVGKAQHSQETVLPLDSGPIKDMVASGKPLIIEDAHKHWPFPPELRPPDFDIKSLLILPMNIRGRLLGFAAVVSLDRRVRFHPHQVDLAVGIAQAVALAVDNTQLFSQQRQNGVIDERNRLAQDMHDGLAQQLATLIYQLEAVKVLTGSRPTQAKKLLDKALETAGQSLEEARRSVWEKLPEPLEVSSLPDAVGNELEQLVAETNIAVTLTGAGVRTRLTKQVKRSLWLIFQEALGNIRRHAQADRISVDLSFVDDSVDLILIDNGHGFDPQVEHAGHGLSGMRRRAAALGGSCRIESHPGRGTMVAIKIPIGVHKVAG